MRRNESGGDVGNLVYMEFLGGTVGVIDWKRKIRENLDLFTLRRFISVGDHT